MTPDKQEPREHEVTSAEAPLERTAQEQLHEQLCSLAFGELTGDKARALEARLNAEPELQVEYDELRATIGLVQQNLVQGESLPADRLAAVLAGAQGAQPGNAVLDTSADSGGRVLSMAWHRRPLVRMAAGVVILAGAGLIGLRVMENKAEAPAVNLDASVGRADAGKTQASKDSRRAAWSSTGQVAGNAPGAAGAAESPISKRADTSKGAELFRLELDVLEVPLERAPESSPAHVGPFKGEGAARSGSTYNETTRSRLSGSASAPQAETTPQVRYVGRAGADPGKAAMELEGFELGASFRERLAFEPPVVDTPTIGGLTVEEVSRGLGAMRSLDLDGTGASIVAPKADNPSAGFFVVGSDERGGESQDSRLQARSMERLKDVKDGAQLTVPKQSRPSPPGTAAPSSPVPLTKEMESHSLTSVTAVDELTVGERDKADDVSGDAFSRRLRRYQDGGANPRLSADQLEAFAAEEWARVQDRCIRRPSERPQDMYFRFWGDNAFVNASQDALSTFAADVDTASYALARRTLREGRLPVKAQIRTEEFVNAFSPDLPAPSDGTFGLHMELAPSPFSSDAYGAATERYLMRVGVRGKEVALSERDPLNLTFVVDTSGSMREGGRLELVKHAIRLLVSQLDARDTIAIVAYSNEARQILLPTAADERNLIESAIHPLAPNGSTNAEAGLKMGYALAETMLKVGTHNRVVFLSDGVANMGETDQDRISADVRRLRDLGIYLNTIGVGMSNHNDVFLEQLADKGDGICDYVDDAKGAERAIVERFTGAFIPIASDVKLQVQFDPTQVLRWRQLGYENRAIAHRDFRNDKIDAGEVGAGHQVTCLYEIELVASAEDVPINRSVESTALATALATLRVRWKAPKAAGQDPQEIDVFETEMSLGSGAGVASFETASAGFRRSALAAQFAEFLRRSSHARYDSYPAFAQAIGSLLDAVAGERGPESGAFTEELVELGDLVRRADEMGLSRGRLAVSDLEQTIEAYRRYQYLKATLEDLESDSKAETLRQLEDTNRTLENRIRDLIRRDLRKKHG